MKQKKLTLDTIVLYKCDTCEMTEEVRIGDILSKEDLKDQKNLKLPLILCGLCPDGEIAPVDYPCSDEHLFDFEDDL